MKAVHQIADYQDELGNTIVGTPKSATGSKVVFRAKGCTLEIAEGVRLQNCVVLFDCDGGRCVIGPGSQFKGTIRVGLGCSVILGSGLTVTNNCYISTAERTSVRVGDDCMFASNNEIRADDAHPIYDMATGKRLNPSRSIEIGDHVWLAAEAVLLSGSRVGDGSVVGFRSLLKSHVPPNSVAAGSPARVLREGVLWKRSHLTLTAPYFFPDLEGPAPAPVRRGTTHALARKLVQNPRGFFADSRHPALRALASLIRGPR